jgi:predicted Zn finger-like uncharacterized protein
MRFVCDSCRAQYMISDDKVGAKGVKVRCKKCGHNIVVRSSGAASPKEAEPSNGAASTAQSDSSKSDGAGFPATLGTPPEGGLLSGIEDDEIGAVFDQVLSSGPHKIPAGEVTGDGPSQLDTSELSSDASDTVRKLAEAEAEGGKPGAAAHEWFVAIDEKQVGPLTLEKVKDHWERGEVGPDSLCWRAGFSDWIPLSDATELASVLAPRPSKPVLVMPAVVETPAPVASAPVESAFSAGGLSRSRTSEMPMLASAPVVEESSGWKPSAASVLASLVKEENDALAKPPPKLMPAVEEKPALAMGGLLDVPPPEPAPATKPSPMMAATPAPVAAPYQPPAPAYAPPPQGYAPPPPQGYAPPVQQYAAPPQPYPPTGYPAYPPPTAPAPNQSKMGLIVASVAVVLISVGGGVFVMTRPAAGGPTAPVAGTQPVAPQPTLVAEAPPSAPKAEVPAAQPAAQPVAGTVQNPPTAAAAQPAVTPAPVVPPPSQPVAAPATNGAVAAASPAPTTPPPAEPAAQPAVAPTKSEPIARAEPAESSKTGTRRPTTRSPSRTEDEEDTRTARRPSRPAAEETRSGGGDDEFDELFGPKKTTPKQEPPRGSQSTYIPPEPGRGGNVQDKLGQSDIMQVVLANKPAIVKCVSEQKKKDPGLSGKLVMRWTIDTSGKTKNVSCQTSEFRSTYMATCITGLIKGWSFPKHKVQGQPIDFPFTF